MSTIVENGIKEELMSRGIWGDFVLMREDVKLREGVSTGMANRMVLAKLAEEGKISADVAGKLRPVGRPRKAKKKTDDGDKISSTDENAIGDGGSSESRSEVGKQLGAAFERSLSDVRMDNRDGKYRRDVKVDCGMMVDKETFAGKSCSIFTAFMWAYSNLCFREVNPKEAPSAVAWQMFVDMRTSPALKADMLKSGLGAAMRKAEDDDRSGQRFDGEGIYDLLGTIAEVKG